MAAATPVLERRSDSSSEYMDDMQHNALIRDRYARLIDPNTRLNELMGREEEQEQTAPPADIHSQSEYSRANSRATLFEKRVEEAQPSMQAQPQTQEQPDVRAQAPVNNLPRFVTDARADSYIFRADSPINRRAEQSVQQTVADVAEEEENEDLRPTRTTIQYGSAERMENEVMPASTVKEEQHVTIGKRERIIIGAFVSMVIALFVLVIINSAIISGLNNQVNEAESALNDVQSEYARVYEQVEEAKSAESVYAYALQNGMTQQSED